MTKLTKIRTDNKLVPRACLWCKIPYTPTHGLSRYCSEDCDHKAQVQNKRDRYALGFSYRKDPSSRYFPKPCLNCHSVFTPTSGRDHLCELCKQKRERYKEDVVSALLRTCHNRYKEECNLTREWFEETWEKQEGLCALSGVHMSRNRNQGAGNIFGKDGTKVSIDRMDPDKSYIKSNCRLVCVITNLMRHRQTDEQLYWWCEQILKNKS
jgi:hypothetical protein